MHSAHAVVFLAALSSIILPRLKVWSSPEAVLSKTPNAVQLYGRVEAAMIGGELILDGTRNVWLIIFR